MQLQTYLYVNNSENYPKMIFHYETDEALIARAKKVFKDTATLKEAKKYTDHLLAMKNTELKQSEKDLVSFKDTSLILKVVQVSQLFEQFLDNFLNLDEQVDTGELDEELQKMDEEIKQLNEELDELYPFHTHQKKFQAEMDEMAQVDEELRKIEEEIKEYEKIKEVFTNLLKEMITLM